MARLELALFADYHQFYLQDDDMNAGDLSDAWGGDATKRMLAAVPRAVGVGTARNDTVLVVVELLDAEPAPDPGADLITETSLEVTTGKIVVAGPTAYFPDAARLPAAPGRYHVRVHYHGLGTLSADGLDGADRYHVVLWPGATSPVPPHIVTDRRPPG